MRSMAHAEPQQSQSNWHGSPALAVPRHPPVVADAEPDAEPDAGISLTQGSDEQATKEQATKEQAMNEISRVMRIRSMVSPSRRTARRSVAQGFGQISNVNPGLDAGPEHVGNETIPPPGNVTVNCTSY